MISLIQLLKEVQDSPKAIFLAGPAGSGKSYISTKLIPNTFTVINSDDTYEKLLKASGIGLKQKDFTPDQLSAAAKVQAQAVKQYRSELEKAIGEKPVIAPNSNFQYSKKSINKQIASRSTLPGARNGGNLTQKMLKYAL